MNRCVADAIGKLPGHVQAHTGFVTVSWLNDMFPGNGVQQGLRYVFPCMMGVSKMSAQSAAYVYNPRGIKETARTMGPNKVVYKRVSCS